MAKVKNKVKNEKKINTISHDAVHIAVATPLPFPSGQFEYVRTTTKTEYPLPEKELFRSLVHNTYSYAVCSLICFVNEKSIQDYQSIVAFFTVDVYGGRELPLYFFFL